MEKTSYVDGLTEHETEYIAQQKSFYMATYGENGYPYVQHRGGPAGFVKVIDTSTIGIVDFVGNRQYISVGNLLRNPKVAIIMVSYPNRARLKIYAEAEIVELKDDDHLFELLQPDDYKFRPERMMLFKIKAYDWNCPQHITPRFTVNQIGEVLAPQKKYIADLEQQIAILKDALSNRQPPA